MDDSLFFLYSADGKALTKKFTRPQRGKEIQKTSYPHVFKFNSSDTTYADLRSFYDRLRYHADRGGCLLKGKLARPLEDESRAGSTTPNDETFWLCLDFDGVSGLSDADAALQALGLQDVNYIVQMSASAGIVESEDGEPTFNAHIFMLLESGQRPSSLKLWAKHKNLTTPVLHDQMTLTRSHNALKWPLDISVNQNDKLIYIAPPEVYDGIQDPHQGKRIHLVRRRGSSDFIPDNYFELETLVPAQVDKRQTARLNVLREQLDLPKVRDITTKSYKGVEVGRTPVEANVTGVKEERGYVYLNLNGGNSWGYFFPRSNPEILYNFKGEQNYALKNIAPSVYEQYKNEVDQYKREVRERALAEQNTGRVHLGFTDAISDRYYRGVYDYDADSCDFRPTNSLVKVQHYLKSHGVPVGDFVEEWEYSFRFDDARSFDPERRFINRYQRSKYLRDADACSGDSSAWPTIRKVIRHVVGDDNATEEYFLNWLGFILQHRRPARTSWLFHGVQGTGKGVLFNHVLAPLVGRDYVHIKRLEEIEEDFNGYMQDCIFLLVDEIQLSNAKHRDRAMAKLKNLIVEPMVSIRAMRTDAFMAKNNMNIIFASNKPDPIEIDPTDRRMNVGVYQEGKLEISQKEIEALRDELPEFAAYLMQMEVNNDEATFPMDSESKQHIQYLTRTGIDLFSDALRDGNIRYFFDGLPSSQQAVATELDVSSSVKDSRYRQIVAEMFNALLTNEGKMNITREELRFIATYLLGKVPDSPNKFTSFVKHHGIDIKPVSIDGKTKQGIQVQWVATDDLIREWTTQWQTDEEKKSLKVIKGGKQ